MRGVLTIPASALLLGLCSPVGHAQARDGGDAPPAARLAAAPADVARAVREILRNTDGVADDVQVARLVALGEPAVPPLFALAVGAPDAEAAADTRTPAPARGDEAEASPDAQRLALAALKALPPVAVDSFVAAAAARTEDLKISLPIVTLAGDLGRASSLELLKRIVAALPPPLRDHPVLGGTLRSALVKVLRADVAAPRALPDFAAAMPAGLSRFVFDAIHEVRGAERVALLSGLLGRRDEWDVAIVAELDADPPRDEAGCAAVADLLRAHAGDRSPEMRRQVAESLRRYPSPDSVQALIGLLDDGDARVEQVAKRSLATATGACLPASADRWRDWLEFEERWLAAEWPAVERSLDSGKPQEVLKSLALLGRKRVHGAVVGHAVATALHHPRPEFRMAACDALERLGTPIGQTDARELAADDPDPRVRASARRLLARMGVEP
jgi:hypothetical protein